MQPHDTFGQPLPGLLGPRFSMACMLSSTSLLALAWVINKRIQELEHGDPFL